jgi:hypothetical protein
MNPESMNAMSESLYRAVQMMIQYITLMVGLASALFILVCIIIAALDFFAAIARPARRQMKHARQ